MFSRVMVLFPYTYIYSYFNLMKQQSYILKEYEQNVTLKPSLERKYKKKTHNSKIGQ